LALQLEINSPSSMNPVVTLPLLPVTAGNITEFSRSGEEEINSENQNVTERIRSLENIVRDMQLDMAELRKQANSYGAHYISLTSTRNYDAPEIIVWDGFRTPVVPSGDHYNISDDSKMILIKRKGLYQIVVRLLHRNQKLYSVLNAASSLLLNGNVAAHFFHTTTSTHLNTAQIVEILELQRGDMVTVDCGVGGVRGGLNSNRMTVIQLQDQDDFIGFT